MKRENVISFVASPLMKYAFLASLDEINGILFQKFEYPLSIMTLASKVIKKLSFFHINTFTKNTFDLDVK